MSDIIVVTAATGNIGSKLARQLLAAGKRVRVVGRKADRLKPFLEKGAEAAVGNLEDAAFAAKAFEGARAVFALIPPGYGAADYRAYQDGLGEAIVAGIERCGVKHVVHLSSFGADLPEGTGFIAGLHRQEQRLDALEGVHVLHQRPAFFMENHFFQIPSIKQDGAAAGALNGDLAIPQIATADIAADAAKALSDLVFTGKSVRYLLGPRDLSMKESMSILGAAIGKPDLAYARVPYEELRGHLPEFGFSQSAAELYIEMMRAFNDGKIKAPERTEKNSTPTTLEQFSTFFAGAFKAPAAA